MKGCVVAARKGLVSREAKVGNIPGCGREARKPEASATTLMVLWAWADD